MLCVFSAQAFGSLHAARRAILLYTVVPITNVEGIPNLDYGTGLVALAFLHARILSCWYCAVKESLVTSLMAMLSMTWKRMSSGELPGLQNRRTASLMSSVRSTRTRFRQFVFSKMRRI